MSTSKLLWANTFLLIIASTFRAWNLGFHKESYIVSCVCQFPLLYSAYVRSDFNGLLLNGFYVFSSMIAIYRW